MTPIFLPHNVLDAVSDIEAALLPPPEALGRERLRALRDLAISQGAHVLLLLWPDTEWVMLAVEAPAGVNVNDARQLIPNLLVNPKALQQMHEGSRQGEHLSWLVLERPNRLH